MEPEETLKQLISQRDTLEKRLANTTDNFFIYGLVRQIRELNEKIDAIDLQIRQQSKPVKD